ncbi:MAG: T9SS type A sorting domain-containing protein [Saprospiraceae bacterium]|nr:T9SS type A sorting domain-containing protein [Saprospiraceae bacterium]
MFKRIHLTGTKEVLAFSNIQNETDLINFNAAMYFDGKQQPIRLPLGQGLLNKLSIFSVFIPTDDLEEQCLWQLERNSRNELMLTTQRLADMESRYFLEIKGARKGQPMLSVYERHLKPDTLPIVSQCLIVGAQPVLPETPVQAFRGHIAEIIVYDWVLSPVERRQVETYLAIKYGIPLEPYKNAGYYDAASHKVKQNKDFLYRTAGIGRDDASGLYQKQSSGIEEPELLKLFVGSLALSNAANQSEVPDKTYLLWSDNGATLRLNAPRPGMPAMIGRSWEMTVSTDSPNISTTLRFDTRRTNSSRKPEDTWWVVCDQGGRGRFNPETTLYTPASSVSAEGLSVFTNLIWDADRSGSDVFSIAVAPHMFAKYWIDPPMCKSEKNGQLYIGAEGGSLPYRFKLLELNGDFCKEWTTIDHNFERIEGIEPGEYLLSVFDDQGRAFHDTLWVQSSDAPVAQLPSRYELEQGKSIILDAAQHFIPTPGTIFSWSGPQGFLQEGSLISISLPGIYLLSIEHDGCVSRQQIEVVAQQGSVFKGLRLFPNPAPNGRFSIMIDLIRPEAVTIRITDAVGRIVAEQSLRGSDYYFHQFIQALPSGLYQITFQSSSEMQTIPLIIQSN